MTEGERAKQAASGDFIAQADRGGTAIVNVYQTAAPAPVDAERLAAAEARLAELPLDVIPEPAPLPAGSRMGLARNALFVGRDQDLKALAVALKAGETAAVGPRAAILAARRRPRSLSGRECPGMEGCKGCAPAALSRPTGLRCGPLPWPARCRCEAR